MPRTPLTKTTPLGSLPAALPLVVNSADLTMTAADISNLNAFVASGKDLIVVQNSHASTPYTVTITSIAKDGRTGDITTYSLAAGVIAVFGPLQTPGWRQTDGSVYMQGSNAAIKFGVIDISNF